MAPDRKTKWNGVGHRSMVNMTADGMQPGPGVLFHLSSSISIRSSHHQLREDWLSFASKHAACRVLRQELSTKSGLILFLKKKNKGNSFYQ
jgi:hypothetical protein